MEPSRNVEFKAHFPLVSDFDALSSRLGAQVIGTHEQEDIYLTTDYGRLKVRTTDGRRELIFYDRLNSANARESTYLRAPLSGDCSAIEPVLMAGTATPVTIHKQRTVLHAAEAIINADVVRDLGVFIEVEVPVERAGSPERATQIAHDLRKRLGITHADLIPFSYSDLLLMRRVAAQERKELASVYRPGKLYLLDGVSASGKTSLLTAVIQDPTLDAELVPRHTTRAPRSGASEVEYQFVSAHEFHRMVSTGAFIEFRDFAFGMSYGLSWEAAMKPVFAGRDGIALINLGIVRHVADLWPEAIRILVDAPPETLERRLRARGYNTEEQIQERLGNATLIEDYRPYYDHVILNDDGMFEQSVAELAGIIRSGHR
jgi:guanylate kinase